MTRGRRIAAEGVGTAFLLAAVVGSGIMGERLAGGNVAIALLANTLATGAMLVTLPSLSGWDDLGPEAPTPALVQDSLSDSQYLYNWTHSLRKR